MLSFFDKQDGGFSLEMAYIAAWKTPPDDAGGAAGGKDSQSDCEADLKTANSQEDRHQPRQPWWRSLFCGMI